MSLKLWLPLRGDLHNQGLYNLPNPSISSLTWDDAGKLGQCVNNTAIWHLTDDIIGNVWSVALWLNNRAGTWASSNNIIFCKNGSSSSDTHIYFSIVGGTSLAVGINGSASTLSYSYTFVADTWYHLAATYDGENLSLYINGEQVKTGVSTREYTSGRNNIGLHCRSSSAAGTSRTGQVTAYYSNDLRLYDHCLSKAEVKEISRGLLLHYKLDNNGHKNYFLTDLSTTVTIPENGTSIYTSYVYLDTFLQDDQILKEGTPYVVTYDYVINSVDTSATGGTYRFYSQLNTTICVPNSQMNTHSAPASGHRIEKYNVTADQAEYTSSFRFRWRLQGVGGDSVTISNVRLYLGTAEELSYVSDSSGYGNHGTISGLLTPNNSSNRYSSCMYSASGDSNYITTPELRLPSDAITLNFWFKSSNTTPGSNYHMPLAGTADSNQSYECAIYKTGYFRSGLVVDGTRKVDNCTSTTLLDGNWHMCTMTYDGSIIKRYVDAVMEKSTTASGALTSLSSFVIGKRGTATQYCSKEAYESDVRIYATALSQDDIEELYHTPFSIDSSMKMHMFELSEFNDSIQVKKTGVVSTDEFKQDLKASFYKSNSIEATDFIEK